MSDFSSILGSSFSSADKVLKPLEIIKTSIPELGNALGCGGFPRGRAIELYAEKSGGKTTFSQWIVTEFQKQGLKCAWAPGEPFDKAYALKAGVDLEELTIIEFGYGEDLTYKLKLGLASNLFDLIVVDSINAITPGAIQEATIDSKNMSEKMEAPKMWAEFFKQLDGGYQIKSPNSGKLVKSNVTTININRKSLQEEKDLYWHKLVQKKTVMLFINHRLDKIGVTFGSKQYTPGGTRKDFTFSLRLNLDVKRTVMGKSKGKEILKHKLIRVKPEKNRVGTPLNSIILQFNPNGTINFHGHKVERKSKGEVPEEIKTEPENDTNGLENLKSKMKDINES